MKTQHAITLGLLAFLAACGGSQPLRATAPLADLQAAVRAAEIAFAKTMADRDFAAFQSHVSSEAVFYAGAKAFVGKAAVKESWRGLYEGPAPFSWEPDHVQVLASGTLALSTGPIRSPDGKITGRFNSIWRLEPDGVWRVVFDRGSPVCAPPQ
jgi:ketosteroid isomerase-like protein